MKRLKLFAPLIVLSLAACTDVKSTVTETYYNMRDQGLPAVGDTLSNKPTAKKLVNTGKCPVVEIEKDLSTLSEFGNAARVQPANIMSTVSMSQINSCNYGSKSVTIDAQLTFNGMAGPAVAGSGGQFVYPYFVAIVAPGGKILAKDVFAVSMAYPSGGGNQTHVETIRQIVPMISQSNGAAHKVMIGFQLSEQQLAYNKNNRIQHERAVEQHNQNVKAYQYRQKEMYKNNPEAAIFSPANLAPANGGGISTIDTEDEEKPKSRLNQ